MKFKKAVVVVLVVGLVSVAGAALAHGTDKGGPNRPAEPARWNCGPQNMTPPASACPAPWAGWGQRGPGGCPCGDAAGWQHRQSFNRPCFPFANVPNVPNSPNVPNVPNGNANRPDRSRFFNNNAPVRGQFPGDDRRDGQQRPEGGRARFAPDMPKEIRATAVQAAKLHIDLEDVLSQKPLDRAKAVELYGQIQKLEQEVEAWRFGRKLDRIETVEKDRTAKPEKPAAPQPAK